MSDIVFSIAGIIEDSIVDGPGVRYTIFSQGCAHRCLGCHNMSTWDFDGGYSITFDELLEDIKNKCINRKITFSGGEPYHQDSKFLELMKNLEGFSFGAYSGYDFEDVIENPFTKRLDFLVDGKFILEKRTLSMPFRGSANQRFIDVKSSLYKGYAVEYNF